MGGGKRAKDSAILVVEDEFLIATMLSDMLPLLGYRVLGPANRIAAALDLLQRSAPDGALLDLNLNGEYAYPIAYALRARHIPFAFVTGYSRADDFPADLRAQPRLTKPFEIGRLRTVLAGLSPVIAKASAR